MTREPSVARPRWQRVKEVFSDALTHAPASRSAFLDGVCGVDADLRREVDSLLAAHDEAGPFLSGAAHLDTGLDGTDAAAAVEGRRVGRYRVQGVIGAGGMGTVYRAVRDDDAFQKMVALKLVRGGADSQAIDRRFRQERQILARLHHPNIATILDGGATEEGQPYLVMEYVDGRPITEYCDQHGLGTRQRLALFATVCAAVHHAHQNLVIHRDLKPGNILVTADGTPMLLDFGIAKLLAPDTDLEAAPTASLLPVMTPEYASPEQVRGEPVTTASDVYSLGVLLYELLAGRRPYGLRAESLEEIVRCVCEMDPQPPSSVARTAAADQAITIGPHARPAASELRGDLDTIVLKALRKEPERRYGSVQELSEDVRRHLEGRPVRARPDTLRYRTVKFMGRHRALVAVTALLALALLGGLAATVRQARIAEANRRRAEMRFAEVRKLATSFLFQFDDAIKDLTGATQARNLVVTKALEHLNGLQADQTDDSALKLELSMAYRKVAQIQGGPGGANLGDTQGAMDSYRKALALAEELVREQPDNRSYLHQVARTHRDIATLQASAGDVRGGAESVRAALAIVEKLAQRHPDDYALRQDLQATRRALGDHLVVLGRLDEALAMHEKAAAIATALREERPDDEAALKAWAASLNTLALTVGDPKFPNMGDPARALTLIDEVLDVVSRKASAGPGEHYQTNWAFHLRSRGEIQGGLGDWAGAIQSYRRSVEILDTLLAAEPKDAYKRLSRASSLVNLGEALSEHGDTAQALRKMAEAIEVFRALAESDPANAYHRAYLGYGHALQARALARGGSPAAAIDSYQRAIGLYTTLVEKDASDLQMRLELAWPLLGLGGVHVARARSARDPAAHCARARPYLERARECYLLLQQHFRLSPQQQRELQEAEAGLAWCAAR